MSFISSIRWKFVLIGFLLAFGLSLAFSPVEFLLNYYWAKTFSVHPSTLATASYYLFQFILAQTPLLAGLLVVAFLQARQNKD